MAAMQRIAAALAVLVMAVLVAPAAQGSQGLAWGSCAAWVADGDAPASAQCGTVTVPFDATNPQAGQANLAVIRIPATGSRIGTLMINPGGPGASAVDTVAAMGKALSDTEIGRRFDLVGFDPRGVGHSTPELRCRTDAEADADRRDPRVDYSAAGVAHIEALDRQLAQECLDRMGPTALAGVGTAAAVHDMDAVRAALGDDQLNYLGYSYGTQLGAGYASAFPDRVRAMVLDGAVDPAQDPVAEVVDQMAGFQKAFDAYATDCARSAGCPLGTDPAQFVARYHQLVDPLVSQPGRTADPRGLTYADAYTGTINALYTPRYWKLLTRGLVGLASGGDAGDLLALADDYEGRDRTGHYSNELDAFTAIRCLDAPYPTDPAVWADADRRTRQLAPFLSYGTFTGYAPRDVCAMWPVPPTSAPAPATSPGPGKVLVVSTTGDPATPYDAGVALARQLGASLLTFRGTQHTVVFNGDACVDAATVAFLEAGTAPPGNPVC
jgi:pimeloyl-ACP methyl ester carboxylesterase